MNLWRRFGGFLSLFEDELVDIFPSGFRFRLGLRFKKMPKFEWVLQILSSEPAKAFFVQARTTLLSHRFTWDNEQ